MTMPSIQRRNLVFGSGSLVLLLAAPQLAYGATIVAVRVWPSSDYTRVTLESDTDLVARHFLIADPHRVVIDIDGLELSPMLRDIVGKVQPDDPYIAGVRMGQNQPRVVRRVTVEGEAAVSVDGRRSRTRTRPEAVNDEQIRQVIAQSA